MTEENKDIGNATLENEGQAEVSETQEPTNVEDTKTEDKTETKKPSRDKDNLYEEIEIPEGVSASIEDYVLIMKKDDKELRRELVALIDVKVVKASSSSKDDEGYKIIVSAERSRKIEKSLFGTFKAHIKNMVKGFGEDFTYKLKIANVHFPMNVSVDKGKNELVVKNFLGEKKDRVIKLLDEVDVKVDNEDVIVTSYDIEKAGHMATKIEKGTKVRNKDRRIFQDGIFLISKPNKEFM